ncbi:MAG TPA: hypothetical protein ENJ02_08405 [Chloroflexi bacterium]|nr:hypothetical protein [Chloroflexota bacterium]
MYEPGNPFNGKFLPSEATLSTLKRGALLLLVFVLLYYVGHFWPEGFDWRHFFSKGRYPSLWMPWTKVIVDALNYPAIFAITVLSLAIRSYRYRPSVPALVLGFISLPTLWMLFLGNLDGLAALGLLTLPFGAPLVLIKPQIASFALLAKKNSFLVGVVWVVFSFVVWGFWPLNLLTVLGAGWHEEWVQDISLFPWGLLLALPLLWLSRGDEDLLMAAGSLGTPHLFPYHFIVLMPALARMRWPWMLLTWAVSWTPLLSNWLGPWAWHFGNLMSVCFWVGIYLNKTRSSDESG